MRKPSGDRGTLAESRAVRKAGGIKDAALKALRGRSPGDGLRPPGFTEVAFRQGTGAHPQPRPSSKPTVAPRLRTIYIDRVAKKRVKARTEERRPLAGGRKRVLVVLFIPSVQRDGSTSIDQNHWVDAALFDVREGIRRRDGLSEGEGHLA